MRCAQQVDGPEYQEVDGDRRQNAGKRLAGEDGTGGGLAGSTELGLTPVLEGWRGRG